MYSTKSSTIKVIQFLENNLIVILIMEDSQKPIIVFLGSGGHIAPKVIEELLFSFDIVGISRNSKNYSEKKGFVGFEFNFEENNFESIKSLINKIYLDYGDRIIGFVFNFYYGYPEKPDSLNDKSIFDACMGIFGKQMQIIKSIIDQFDSYLSIIILSSMYANSNPVMQNYEQKSDFNALLYGSMKAALEKGSKWFISYNQESKIRINIIRLGPFPNNNVQKKQKTFISNLKNNTSTNTIGEPKDIVGAIEFLISKKSKFCQGSILTIDGGWSIS